MNFSISWTTRDGGGHDFVSSWDEINIQLEPLKKSSGTITLDIHYQDRDALGPQSLQVISNGMYYLITLGEDDGEEYIVRTYSNKKGTDKKIELSGGVWDERMLCTDFNIVINVFKEFFETGNVSYDMLSE